MVGLITGPYCHTLAYSNTLVKTGSDLQARSVQAPGVHLQESWVLTTGAADKVPAAAGARTAHP